MQQRGGSDKGGVLSVKMVHFMYSPKSFNQKKNSSTPKSLIPRFNPTVYSFMDNKKEPGNLFVEDTTRESLIAISYRVPDKDPTAEELTKRVKGENVVEIPGRDIDDKYRSKLISISYSPPTNVKVLPILPGKLDG